MTSQEQAKAPLLVCAAWIFFGFPLHAAGKLLQERAAHLSDVTIPMLFLQGTRDALAELGELQPVCAALGASRDLDAVRGCGSFFPRAGAHRPQGRRGYGRDAG